MQHMGSLSQLPPEVVWEIALAGGLTAAAALCCTCRGYHVQLAGLAALHRRRVRTHAVTWYGSMLLFQRVGRMLAVNDQVREDAPEEAIEDVRTEAVLAARQLTRPEAAHMLTEDTNASWFFLLLRSVVPPALEVAAPLLRRPVLSAMRRHMLPARRLFFCPGQNWLNADPPFVDILKQYDSPLAKCWDCGHVVPDTRVPPVPAWDREVCTTLAFYQDHQGCERIRLSLVPELPLRLLQLMCVEQLAAPLLSSLAELDVQD